MEESVPEVNSPPHRGGVSTVSPRKCQDQMSPSKSSRMICITGFFSTWFPLHITIVMWDCPIRQIVASDPRHQITFMANWRVHSWSTLGTHLDHIWNTFVTHLEQISSTLWTNWKDFCNTSVQCWWNQEDVVVQSIFVGKAEVCVVLNCKSSSSRGNTVLVRGTCASLSGEKTCACS